MENVEICKVNFELSLQKALRISFVFQLDSIINQHRMKNGNGTHERGNKSVVIVYSSAVFNSSTVQSVSLTFHHSFLDGPIISH